METKTKKKTRRRNGDLSIYLSMYVQTHCLLDLLSSWWNFLPNLKLDVTVSVN